MSLCDRCFAPGHCCRRLQLFDGGELRTYWTDQGAVTVQEQLKEHGLPFIPLEQSGKTHVDKETGRPYAAWDLTCKNIGADGRCMDYENRPKLCRNYEPGSDFLCVHYRGAEGVDLSNGWLKWH